MEESGLAIKLAQGIIHRCDACGGAASQDLLPISL